MPRVCHVSPRGVWRSAYAGGSPTGLTPAIRLGAAVRSRAGSSARYIFITELSNAIGADAAPAGCTYGRAVGPWSGSLKGGIPWHPSCSTVSVRGATNSQRRLAKVVEMWGDLRRSLGR